MSDEADLAQARMEHEEELRRKYAQVSTEVPEGTGKCLNCGEPVKKGHRWCDVFCRADHLAREIRKK